MKKALILVCSLFLVSSLNCATTEQEISKTEEPAKKAEKATETVAEKFDLTGTWISTEAVHSCDNSERTNTYTIEITQEGDSVTIVNKERGRTSVGKIYGNEILWPAINTVTKGARSSGTLSTSAYKSKISKDANTITTKLKWRWQKDAVASPCDGISYFTVKRK